MLNKKEGNKYWKTLSILFFIIFIITLFSFVYYSFTIINIKTSDNNSLNTIKNNTYDKIKKKEKKECTNCKRRLIDGIYTKDNDDPYPFAFVIDNNISSRPAHGLSQAKLVYEVEVEGGITRYLAIFDTNSDFKEVGPIRSARPYFIDWTSGLSSTLIHCGGSPSALALIIKEDIDDINEFFNETYFERDKTIKAPYNIFMSKDNLERYAKKNNLIQSKILSFNFKEDDKHNEELGYQGIKIDYKKGYNVKWEYNELDNNYLRFLDGKEHFDAENNRIKTKNIIVQFVNAKVVDEKLRLKIDTIGKGKAIICLDGKCKAGTWKKNNIKTRTRYFIDDKEAEFNAGTTWIEIVRNKYKDKIIY